MAAIVTSCTDRLDFQSFNERPAFTVAELEDFFDTCPLEILSERFLRLLRGMWRESGKPFGREIQLFGGNVRFQRGCRYKNDRTVRRNIPVALDQGYLEIAHQGKDRRGNLRTHHIWIRQRIDGDRGLYRTVTTYRLSVPLLLKWREWKRQSYRRRPMPVRQPSASPPVPHPQPKQEQRHRSTIPAAEQKSQPMVLGKRETTKIVGELTELMKGCSRYVGLDGYGFDLKPGDPRYMPRMPLEAALVAVAERWHRSVESLREALKFWKYEFRE